MLAVTVHLHGAIEALAQGQPQSRLHRAANAKVAAQAHHAGAVLAGDFGGPVGRGIVDDHDLRRETVSLGHGAQLGQQRGQAAFFIKRRHNNEDSHPAGRTISRHFTGRARGRKIQTDAMPRLDGVWSG